MTGFLTRWIGSALAFALLAALAAPAQAAEEAKGAVAHVVYFTLKDHSPAARAKMVDACKTYLTGHDGVLSFAVGTIAQDVEEPVSDRDFDVSIHVVFRDKAAGAAYQVHPRHKRFIEENKASWAKVRVFDSYLAAP